MHACAMNQTPQSQPPHRHPVFTPRPPSNGLGVAGFIVSLVGLLATCGALAPVGLLLSGVAMFKRPRGFATAGVIVGLIGTVIFGVIATVGIGAVGIAKEQVRMQEQLAERERAQLQIAGLAERVGVFHQQNARPPLALDLLPFVDPTMLTDPWGRAYEFEPELDGFTIRSVGPDGAGFTDDDVVQTWDFVREGITPRPLKAEPEAMGDSAAERDGSLFGVPTPPVPLTPPQAPVPPVAPTAPTPPVAPETL